MGHRSEWVRRTSALVSAFALVFHIAVLALEAGHQPVNVSEAVQAHAYHAASAADHDAGAPEKSTGHKRPCCILSACPGLPTPPAVSAFAPPTAPATDPLVLCVGASEPDRSLSLLLPVGARAPPMPV